MILLVTGMPMALNVRILILFFEHIFNEIFADINSVQTKQNTGVL